MRDNKREGQRLLLCGVLCVLLGLALCFATACSAQPSKGDVTGESELVSGQITDDESIDSPPTDGEKSPTLILRDGIVDLEKRTVEVKVEIGNNPGISALQFSVHYGDELTLRRVEFDDRFGAYVTAPIPYEATIAPTLKVESVSVNHGTATVDVVISLINNPGLASLQFIVDFDERLTLTAIRFNEELGDYVTAPEPFTNHQKITFMSPLKDSYVSGEFAVLTFAVDASALVGDDLAVGLTLVQENTMDSEFNSVELDTVNGTVTVNG